MCGGTVEGEAVLPSGRRSIPACAGEPLRHCPRASSQSVYPRVCGGTSQSVDDVNVHGGLSPRVRGNRLPPAAAGDDVGSIPACAGEPAQSEMRWQSTAVYPRVCGGTLPTGLRDINQRGLSPRVRGNLPLLPIRKGIAGSIPACAGEPAYLSCLYHSCTVYPRVCGGTY